MQAQDELLSHNMQKSSSVQKLSTLTQNNLERLDGASRASGLTLERNCTVKSIQNSARSGSQYLGGRS